MGQLASQCNEGPLVPQHLVSQQCNSCSSRERTIDFDFLENEHDVTSHVGEGEISIPALSTPNTQLVDPAQYDHYGVSRAELSPRRRALETLGNTRFIEAIHGPPAAAALRGRPAAPSIAHQMFAWNPKFYCLALSLVALLFYVSYDIVQRRNPNMDVLAWLNFPTSTATSTTMSTTTTSTVSTSTISTSTVSSTTVTWTTAFGFSDPAFGAAIAANDNAKIPLAVDLRLQHIPYEGLMNDTDLRSAVSMEIAHAIALVVGNGISPDQVHVTFAEDLQWTIAAVTLKDVHATAAARIVQDVNVTTLGEVVATSLGSVHGIEHASTGPINSIHVSRIRIWSADEPEPSFSSHSLPDKVLLIGGSLALVAVVVVGVTILFFKHRARQSSPGYRTLARGGGAVQSTNSRLPANEGDPAAAPPPSSSRLDAKEHDVSIAVSATLPPSREGTLSAVPPVLPVKSEEATQVDDSIEQLCGMGFSEDAARSALEVANGDVEEAATALLTGGPAVVGALQSSEPSPKASRPAEPPAEASDVGAPLAETLTPQTLTPVSIKRDRPRVSQLERKTGLLIDSAEVEKLDTLLGMGFSDEQSIRALRDAGGDPEAALEKLLASQ